MQSDLELDDALVFYNFPLFRDDEQLVAVDLVIVAPLHGVALISTEHGVAGGRDSAADRLDGTFSQLFARLIKYAKLRSERTKLAFEVEAFLWSEEESGDASHIVGLPVLDARLRAMRRDEPIPADVFAELVSVVDGSKALVRPRERATAGFDDKSKVRTIARLEEEIRRFDRDQRVAYMTEVGGPQRIRGLAGSGKTVVLALKAALTAIKEPDARIAVTFYTKSLYQHIKQLITRFYRMHEDRDPDWDRIQVLHAWGGATANGLYYQTARRFGHQALTFSQASTYSPNDPFAFACRQLLTDSALGHAFDYVFVDEAQDFPAEFMQLALRIAEDEKLVIAYDVFQTIFDVEIPTASSMFGTDEHDAPDIVFEEDVILHKCYRNPREVLVCAHAIGFGIYGSKIVQMLESAEHWEDFGYEVRQGTLAANERVVITRPEENSPNSISASHSIDEIIQAKSFETFKDEIEHVAARVLSDIRDEGVPPEEVLIVCADDRNASGYFKLLRAELAAKGLKVNNLQDDTYSIRDFQQSGCVTLSTIYKAKGNEAYCVYLVGIDSLFYQPSPRTRNRVFTAMTRAKGWLYVTGIGFAADAFVKELTQAKKNYPDLVFNYPSPEQLVYMKRDLVQMDPAEADETLNKMMSDMEPDEVEHLLRKKLRELQARKRTKKKIK